MTAFLHPSRRTLLKLALASGAVFGAAPLLGRRALAQPKTGGVLQLAVSETIDTLDTYTTNATLVRTMLHHVHGQLYTYSGEYGLIPDLAEGHEVSQDGLTWTFRLRPGVSFHDGSEMVAEDVLASWERFMSISPRAGSIAVGLEKVEAPDPHTVVFTFSQDPGPFLAKLSTPHTSFKIHPAAISRAAMGRPLEYAEMTGTGPFKLGEWKRGESLAMDRFEGYSTDTRYEGPDGLGGRRTAYLDQVVWNFIAEPGAQDAGLQTGRFHFADAVPVETRAQVEARAGFAGTIIKPLNWMNLMVNHHNPPLDDIRIRRAIQIGLDQELVLLAAIGDPDLTRLSPGLAFEEQEWFSTAGAEYYNRNDKEAARALVKEANYDGREIVLMTTRTLDNLYRGAVVIQQELQQIGLKVRLEVLDWAALIGHVTTLDLRPKWHLSSMEHSIRHDPFGWDTNFRSDKWTPYASAQMDGLLDEIARLRDHEARYAAFEKVQALFYEDVVNIKNGDYFGWHAHSAKLQGYRSFEGYLFWDTWLDA